MVEYVPVLLFLLVAAIVPTMILVTAWALRPSRPEQVKGEAYECGVVSSHVQEARLGKKSQALCRVA